MYNLFLVAILITDNLIWQGSDNEIAIADRHLFEASYYDCELQIKWNIQHYKHFEKEVATWNPRRINVWQADMELRLEVWSYLRLVKADYGHFEDIHWSRNLKITQCVTPHAKISALYRLRELLDDDFWFGYMPTGIPNYN